MDHRGTVTLALVAIAACSKRAETPGIPPLPTARVEMCAAYPFDPNTTHAVVIERSGSPGEVVSFHDRDYNVHHSDCVKLGPGELRDIAWVKDGSQVMLGIRFVDAAADRVEARTENRMSQLDALYIDGELYTVALHEHVVDSLWLSDTDRTRQATFYSRLTGELPPR